MSTPTRLSLFTLALVACVPTHETSNEHDAQPVSSEETCTPEHMRPAQPNDIEAHLTEGGHAHWTKAASLVMQGTSACVDGRDVHGIIGTPGGDAGELVLVLAAAEDVRKSPFTPERIEELFDAYLEAFGRFYMHTDDHAVDALFDDLLAAGVVDILPTADEERAQLLQHPPAELEDALLERVADPRFVGCGHLRLMLQNSETYGVRQEVVQTVIRTFFRRLWAGGEADLDFVVLHGQHEESAVVQVHLDTTEVHAYTKVPLVSPRLGDTEVFVYHPDVARFMRREHGAYLLELEPSLRETLPDGRLFFQALDHLADRQAEATFGKLAGGLPAYDVHVHGDSFEVTGPNHPEDVAVNERAAQ